MKITSMINNYWWLIFILTPSHRPASKIMAAFNVLLSFAVWWIWIISRLYCEFDFEKKPHHNGFSSSSYRAVPSLTSLVTEHLKNNPLQILTVCKITIKLHSSINMYLVCVNYMFVWGVCVWGVCVCVYVCARYCVCVCTCVVSCDKYMYVCMFVGIVHL